MRFRKLISFLSFPIIFCLVLITTGFLLFWYGLEIPYREFRAKEQETISLFDSQNEGVWSDLPPLPPSTIISRKYSDGIVYPFLYLHGRRLNIEGETTMSADEVYNYYSMALLEKGWRLHFKEEPWVNPELDIKEGDMSYYFGYYRGTSCIEISTPPGFSISIWHNYESQSFAPAMPNPTFMWVRETGMGGVLKCPGSW